MTAIYVVTAGIYSDYHIVALFSTQEPAQKLATKLDGNVETYTPDPEIVYPTMPYFGVSLRRDTGAVASCWEKDDMNDSTGEMYRSPVYHLTRWGTIDVYCYAPTEAHAIKIATEILAQVNAENLWRFTEGMWCNFRTDEEIAQMRQDEATGLISDE